MMQPMMQPMVQTDTASTHKIEVGRATVQIAAMNQDSQSVSSDFPTLHQEALQVGVEISSILLLFQWFVEVLGISGRLTFEDIKNRKRASENAGFDQSKHSNQQSSSQN